jgi:Uncharacterised nucleotidyltransferase
MATAAEPQLFLSNGPSLPAIRTSANSSEFDLLLACCASHNHEDRIRNVLSRPVDWDRVLHLVDHHRVVLQVYGALSPFSRLIPDLPLHALQVRYRDNARKALWFAAELLRIVDRLESAGIKALPYKGPVLAHTLYGEVTQRQFSDIDILILPEDVLQSKAALLELGYKAEIELAPHLEKAFIESAYEHPFRSQQTSTLMELKWRIAPRFYCFDFDVAALFQRADEINFGGRLMRTLCPQDLLLVLCAHAAKHVWVQLSWLCDIAQLAKSPQLDWNAIQHEADRLGIKRIINLNLLLAHELLGTPLPEYFKPNCHSERSEESAVVDEILRVIKRSAHYDTESLPYFRLMMRLRERRRDRARLLWRLGLTPSMSEWSSVPLPKPLQSLYRLVRLSRLAKRLALVAHPE